MLAEQIKPTDYFDPEQWSSIYETHKKSNSTFVFKHGVDLVQDISSRIGCSGELWLDIGVARGI
jgi:hypothetical protein